MIDADHTHDLSASRLAPPAPIGSTGTVRRIPVLVTVVLFALAGCGSDPQPPANPTPTGGTPSVGASGLGRPVGHAERVGRAT